MKINQIIHEAGTGLEIDRSIPGRTIARISGDLAYRTGPLTDKKLPDHHDDYTPWSGKVGASTRDDEEDTFDIDYTGDDGELKEFVQQAPVAVPADDALPTQGYAIKVHGPFGHRFGGIAAATLWYALSAVFPDRYPPRDYQNYGAQLDSPQSRVLNQIHRTGSAVVADGIAGRDLAETLANKLAMFKPEDQYLRPLGSKHVEVVESGLNEAVEDYAGTYSPEAIAIGKKFCDQYNITDDTDVQLAVELIDAYLDEFKWRNIPVDLNVLKSKVAKDFRNVYRGMGPGPSFRKKFQEQGMAEGTARLPDPNNFDSDNDYRNALDAYGKPQAMDADYENMISEPDDWFDESKEKIGNMDADAFDAALSRMKKLAGAGPLRTVYDPNKRVYKNVPHAVQPAQQPKKAR